MSRRVRHAVSPARTSGVRVMMAPRLIERTGIVRAPKMAGRLEAPEVNRGELTMNSPAADLLVRQADLREQGGEPRLATQRIERFPHAQEDETGFLLGPCPLQVSKGVGHISEARIHEGYGAGVHEASADLGLQQVLQDGLRVRPAAGSRVAVPLERHHR